MSFAAVLRDILGTDRGRVTEVSRLTGIVYSTVSAHMHGRRPVTSDHIVAYLQATEPADRPRLLGAWLHHVLPEGLRGELLTPGEGTRVAEPVAEYAPELAGETKRALDFLRGALRDDEGLEALFLSWCRWMGWDG